MVKLLSELSSNCFTYILISQASSLSWLYCWSGVVEPIECSRVLQNKSLVLKSLWQDHFRQLSLALTPLKQIFLSHSSLWIPGLFLITENTSEYGRFKHRGRMECISNLCYSTDVAANCLWRTSSSLNHVQRSWMFTFFSWFPDVNVFLVTVCWVIWVMR